MGNSKRQIKETGLESTARFDTLLSDAVTDVSRELFKDRSAPVPRLILTGSISRGEGTFLSDGSGGIRLLGDVEFLLVCEPGSGGSTLAKEFEARLKKILSESGVETTVDVGYVRPDYFTRLKPHIFGVELKSHAKVLYGDESILETIPDISAEDIPRWDAIHLLYNRMVEQMMHLDGLLNGGAVEIKKAHYQNIKFTLDVAGSLLVFQGSYRTTYLERSMVIGEAVETIDHFFARKCLSKLPGEVSHWTSIKLDPQSDGILSWDGSLTELEANREIVFKRWLELVRIVHNLWIWEMSSYLDGKWSDDTETLLKSYLKSERLASKAHGWAKWASRVRSSGAVPYLRLLKLFPVGSPRALIYASAALLYFSLPYALNTNTPEEDGEGIWQDSARKAGRLLPGLSGEVATDWPTICNSVVGSWKEHVKNG